MFGPGFHRGQYYSPSDCRQIAANFARLVGVLTPTVKLGHDREQRLKVSTGFPNLGRVTRCECGPDGVIVLDLDGVPPEIAGKINSGQLNSGSIELKAGVPDPTDPAKKLPGDVLTAVALLGEEQPAIPGFAPPRAVFADGTEVPADHRAAPWLKAMADVVRQMSAESQPDRGEVVICFSDMYQEPPPVDKTAIIAALAALSPEDKAEIAAALAAETAEPDGDELPPAVKAFADKMEKCFADLTTRVGGMEAAKTAQMSAEAEAEEKKFSAEVARAVDAAVKAGTIQPWQKAAFVAQGKGLDNTKVFSDGANKGRTEFAAWADALTSGNVKAFSDSVADVPAAAVGLTPLQRAILNSDSAKRNMPAHTRSTLLATAK